VPSGPRPPARPGSGPGRGKARPARSTARPASAAGAPVPPPSTEPGASGAGSSPIGPSRRGSRLRSSLTTRAIALVVVLLILTISYASSLRIYFAQAHEIASTKADIAERQQRIADLQGGLARWNDPEYVRTQARARLGWVVPGETGYLVVDAEGNPLGGGAAIGSAGSTAAEPQDAWWAKLWGSVEAADKPAPAKPKEKTITLKTKTNDGQR
jgi:cell division protein FtsB